MVRIKCVNPKIVAYKHKQLRRAHFMLVAGFVPLLVDLFIYLGFVPVK